MITTSDFSELNQTISQIVARLFEFEHNYNLIIEWIYDVAAASVAWSFYALPMIVFSVMTGLCYFVPGAFFFWIFLVTRPWLTPVLVYLANTIYLGFFINASYFNFNLSWAVWSAFTLFYSSTFSDSHTTGSRTSSSLKALTPLWDLFVKYFDFQVICETKLSATKNYIFGYHPHGIYPYALMWGPLTSVWKEKLPGIEFSPLGATLVFMVPILRDIALWIGGRDVSRKSINNALRRNQSIALVPGGQAEMRESRSYTDEVVILRRHKGFIRMAIENGTDLVPIYCFGETEIFDNIYLPKIQAWFLKKIGFGFPHFPYGKYYLPVPRNRPMRFVVGAPVEVPKIAQPTPEQIDEVHKKYFDSLEALIEKHKVTCGYPKTYIKFKDD